VCVLAHVIEAAGIATVALTSMIEVTERMHPPRALYCEFPLGRPLGRPNDAEFQHDVLRHAFALLDAPSTPVLARYPETIEAIDSEPLACALPPRYDSSDPPAVAEAKGLAAAYRRSLERRGTTSVGRTTDGAGIPAALGALVRITDGVAWNEAGLPGDPVSLAHDVRDYYEEAAVELVGGNAHPGGAEAWFYEKTEGGKLLLAARRAMQDAKAPFPIWFYMARANR
jgi:hypothetical protein